MKSKFILFIQEGSVWRCIECNKVAEDSKARFRMKNHVQTHMQVFFNLYEKVSAFILAFQGLTVSCNFCDHVGSTSAALRNHKYKKHREMMENTRQEGECKIPACFEYLSHKPTAGKYKCGFCGKGSKSKKGRENHKYKYHKVTFNK